MDRLLILFALVLIAPIAHAESISQVTINKQKFFVSGDQLLDERMAAGIVNGKNVSSFGSRPVDVDLWPDGVLPFQFADDVGPQLQKMILDACAEWASAANIHCQVGEYKGRVLDVARNYLDMIGGCWSMLGSSRYFLWMSRRVNLAPGCGFYPIVLHELGHALGLAHEHQRPDRDDYVIILSYNVSDPYLGFGYSLNFDTQKSELLVPYDFLSIMHYRRNAFSKDGSSDTISPRMAYWKYVDVMGKAQHLSDGDREAIRKLYGPPVKH